MVLPAVSSSLSRNHGNAPQTPATVPVNHPQNPHNNIVKTQGQTSTSVPHHSQNHLKKSSSSSLSEEELAVTRLRHRWRKMASSVVVAIRSAPRTDINSASMENMVQTTFQLRSDLRKGISSIENQLKGRSQELEALEHLMQTRPCAGRRKKRKLSDKDEAKLSDENNENNNLQLSSDPIVDIEVVDLS